MARELGTMEGQRQEFISNVSHEIQSPLTSIIGFADLLKNPRLSEQQRLHYLSIIETESRRLSRLSDNLLRLSALNSDDSTLERSRFALDEQLRSVIVMLEPQWSARQQTLTMDVEKLEITADRELLEQVWINLLHNALKFTPKGGTIAVRLTHDVDGDGATGAGDSRPLIICAITDTGDGIAPGDLPHIFERFYRADRARDRALGGNGLGLPLAKRIVELHGGAITVKSDPGKGATFSVYLPFT
jgi:signal transduction histidine kinase